MACSTHWYDTETVSMDMTDLTQENVSRGSFLVNCVERESGQAVKAKISASSIRNVLKICKDNGLIVNELHDKDGLYRSIERLDLLADAIWQKYNYNSDLKQEATIHSIKKTTLNRTPICHPRKSNRKSKEPSPELQIVYKFIAIISVLVLLITWYVAEEISDENKSFLTVMDWVLQRNGMAI